MQINPSRPGFTLLEFMLALIIVSILLTITIMVSFNAIARTNLRSTENTLMQMIRRAQTQSQQYANGKQWGVYIDETNNKILTFSVNASEHYSSASKENDASYEYNENIDFDDSGLHLKMTTDYGEGYEGLVFERFTGDPIDPQTDAPFTTVAIGGDNGKILMAMFGSTRSLVVNERGVVER